MHRFVALLRAVNVGGHGVVAMSDIRDAFVAAGFENVKTILQAGTVVFHSRRKAAAVEKLAAAALEERCGITPDVFVRNADEWSATIEKNPFVAEAGNDPARLVLFTMRDAPAVESVTQLRDAIRGRERIEVAGREAYIVFPDGQGTSKLTNVLMEKKLATRGTARNWNTVLKVAAALREDA